MASLAGVAVVATTSLFVNGLLTYLLVRTRRDHQKILNRKIRAALKHAMQTMASIRANSENDDEDDVYENRVEDGAAVLQGDELEEENVTGTGDEEDDLFIAPKRDSKRVK